MLQVDDYSATHSTKNEIKFIDGLGTHAPELKGVRKSALLAGYLTGCFKRVNWGDIDPITVIRHATMRLLESIPDVEGPANG